MRVIQKLFLLVSLFAMMGGMSSRAEALLLMPGSNPSIMLLPDGLQVEWQASHSEITLNNDGTARIKVPGFEQTNRPGAPVLPVAGVLLALPYDAQPVLNVQQLEGSSELLLYPVELAPQPEGVIRDESGQVIGGAYVQADHPVTFSPQLVELEELGVVRGVRLARLVFYPARPQGEQLLIARRVQITVRFNSPSTRKGNILPENDPIVTALKRDLINPEQVFPFPRLSERISQSTQVTSVIAVIEVTQKGITQVTGTNLSNASFPVNDTVSTNNLHLTHNGIEVAFEWVSDPDLTLDIYDKFNFYADPSFSRWTITDTYLLSESDSPGLRMTSRSANPAGLSTGKVMLKKQVEINQVYPPEALVKSTPLGHDGDNWMWTTLKRGGIESFTHNLNLPSVNQAETGELKVWTVSFTDLQASPDHRMDVYWNGTKLTTPSIEWDGRQLREETLLIPAGTLVSGNNTFRLQLPGISGLIVEGMWLDAYQLRYILGTGNVTMPFEFEGEATQKSYSITFNETIDPSKFLGYDVTDPNHPQQLGSMSISGQQVTLGDLSGVGSRKYHLTSKRKFLLPTKVWLKSELPAATVGFSGAEYVVITPAEFAPALSPLMDLRESQGLNTLVVDVQAIYDNYSYGRLDPEAIRTFLHRAYHNWITPPIYALLVGDGTHDPKHYDPISFNTYLPPYLADVDPWAGETATDNRFASVDGADPLPDLFIGRLPANSISEVQEMVNKIVQYETNLEAGGWQERVLFVADNADEGGDFPADADNLANNVIPPYIPVSKVYAPAGTKTEVLAAYNAGARLLIYIGHSAYHFWAQETLLHVDDLPGLINGNKQPVVLDLTCFTGAFQNRGISVLDEEMVRTVGNGAVAVWAPTGLGLSAGHSQLAEGFINSIYSQPQVVLGEATLAGKLNLVAQFGIDSDLVETFLLLGDPALRFNLGNYRLYLPLIGK